MEALKKGLLELGRIVVLSAVSWILSGGLELVLNAFGGGLTIEFKVMLTGLITSVFKGLDKYLHELGKELKNDTLTKGIVRF